MEYPLYNDNGMFYLKLFEHLGVLSLAKGVVLIDNSLESWGPSLNKIVVCTFILLKFRSHAHLKFFTQETVRTPLKLDTPFN